MHGANASPGRRKGHRASLADINVTPFVDVVLVLLIIFMVTAPMMQKGVDVELPKAQSAAGQEQQRLIVTIDKANRVYLNDGSAAPFAAVIGQNITADVYDTQSVALGDLDGDGDLDVVTGNRFQRNRVYLNGGPALLWTTTGDGCPLDPAKIAPGACGCGVPETNPCGPGP